MGLLEDLQDDNNFPSPRKDSCSVCSLLKKLPEKESKALQARLDDKYIGHVALARVLQQNEISISDSVMGRHRRGVCRGGARRRP